MVDVDTVPLYHFYHVYADGKWEYPLYEHFDWLSATGLIHNLSEVHLGLVGTQKNRNKVKDQFHLSNSRTSICAEFDYGFEQKTLQALHTHALMNTGCYFYAHTKGSACSTPLRSVWRRSMLHLNTYNWKDIVSTLKSVDTFGAHYWEDVRHNCYGYYAGNYWWATDSHLKSLAPVLSGHRHQAEIWLHSNPPIRGHYSRVPGYPHMSTLRKVADAHPVTRQGCSR